MLKNLLEVPASTAEASTPVEAAAEAVQRIEKQIGETTGTRIQGLPADVYAAHPNWTEDSCKNAGTQQGNLNISADSCLSAAALPPDVYKRQAHGTCTDHTLVPPGTKRPFQQFRSIFLDLDIFKGVCKTVTFAAAVAINTAVGASTVNIHSVILR